jgi:drug/metabolite transporter (DMT)-like permease
MSRRGVVLFLVLGVAWGIPYLLIKVAVGELSPAAVVFGRSALGAVLLLPLALWRRELVVVLRRWRPLLAYTAVEIVLPWYFLSSAEQKLPSSTSALIIAAVPIVGVGVAKLFGRPERMTGGNWLGIAVGTVGVAALVGLDVGGSDLVGVAELVVVVVGYATGPAILAHRMSDLPGIGVVTASLALAAVVYVPVTLLTGGVPTAWPSSSVVISVLTLGIVCSAGAFLALFAFVAEVGPVRATTITYLNPAVAVAAGAIVLGEPVTVWTVAGFVLVLGGAYLATRRRPPVVEADGRFSPATLHNRISPAGSRTRRRSRRPPGTATR